MNIKIISFIIASAFLFQACELEVKQNDAVSSETLYQTEAGALAGLIGIYSALGRSYRDMNVPRYATSFTDEGHFNRIGLSGFVKNNFTSSDPRLRDTWAIYYQGIYAANIFLTSIRDAELNEKVKQEFLAEGYFLRAFIYFDLVKLFGGKEGIPMPLEETIKELLPRTKGIDVYKQIIADLEIAEKYLPEDKDAADGRVGKGAARALLARAYLYMASEPFNEVGAYQKCIRWCKTIMDDAFYKLNPSYQDIFDQLAMGNYEKGETIFQLGYFYDGNNQEASNLASTMGMLVHDEGCGKSYSVINATITLILKYRSDPSDERGLWNTSPWFIPRNNNCERRTHSNQFNIVASKYRRELEEDNTSTSWGSHHFPFIRYAEVLLMYAEAENKLNPGSGSAKDAVNRVRARAKATLIPDETVLTDEMIQEERLLELCFEGHRKFDLVRWGILEETIVEAKAAQESYASDPMFVNDDWSIYGDDDRNGRIPNVGPDGIPLSGDEPEILQIKYNKPHPSFSYFDGYNDFDISKHYILPIPEQEIGINTNLKQTVGW
ncbi:MAG: RagB/SusD family nutrient uptake outer membrane protein [Carboxylicivirga sp.]|jgi:hypothetical protein|nr:RagB/SusD family nutrient uptake outer membrane protein [Carboxylicivirga sp.]